MYVSKKDRETIRLKFNGRCAYSGTPLEPDWQIDHIKPIVRNWWNNTALFPNDHNLDNMFPVQRRINNYKSSIDLETFRRWLLGGLHERLKKLPKNPKTPSQLNTKRVC